MALDKTLKTLTEKTATQVKIDMKAVERALKTIEAAKKAAKTPTK